MFDSTEKQESTPRSGSVVDQAIVEAESTIPSKARPRARSSTTVRSRVPRSPIRATKEQQLRLIQLYISRFCSYFGSFGRMKALNIEVRKRAVASRYNDLRRFHSDYFLKYLELCESTTPYLAGEIRDDLAKFTWGQYHWWPKCKDLPTQSRRRKLVGWAVEKLADRDFDNKSFTTALDEFCEVGYDRPSGG
ncbi:hypothetical protein A1O7_00674 [Cladophialophora yegresii CBS 114405]|uniref:Uncharacterized protein n=1 Tax=Cladophialophora yegresii CBS 114405 TaxID=1182544 RepID=W9W8S8_9EURO|nr:uncharacterized protein A1O7_00674 [Cladophialophora yegresii CBS 114405]EXJ64338.1 hypothetical protein A1O7_00674 [Cladophialophora yegresii CBS 114405]